MDMKPLLLGLGVVVIVVAGTILWLRRDTAEPLPPNPHGALPPSVESHGEGDRQAASFAKVHFMKKFVAALTAPPGNLMPSPDYVPLLKDGVALIRCADCHKDPSLNIEGMLKNDPGDEAVERFRLMREGFMIPLMEKWVARLNKRNADRLVKEVICTDCHAIDPRDEKAIDAALPPLMIRFVKALTAPPENRNPAKGWRPLLKDAHDTSMLCSVCHGQDGAEMEKELGQLDRPLPPGTDENRPFMITLMERWVRELNRRMKDRLVKAVGCTDCHETDPRK